MMDGGLIMAIIHTIVHGHIIMVHAIAADLIIIRIILHTLTTISHIIMEAVADMDMFQVRRVLFTETAALLRQESTTGGLAV